MRSVFALLLAGVLTSGLATAQYGGRENDVVIYAFTAKGNPNPVIVAAGTGSGQPGFEIKDPLTITPTSFGPDFLAESFVDPFNDKNFARCEKLVGRDEQVFRLDYEAEVVTHLIV